VIFWRVGFAGVCPAGVHLAASRRRVHNAPGIQKKKKEKQSKMPSLWLFISMVGSLMAFIKGLPGFYWIYF